MSHCLCGVCEECKERANQIAELIKEAEEFGKKNNCSPLLYFKVLEQARNKK